MITNHHCYISSAALKLENLVNKAIIRTGNRRNQTWKIYQGTKIVSLFWSNDALGTSQLFEDATKIKVHGIIWLMAGFRVAKVTLVPLCVKLEIHHSSAHWNNIKAKYWISLSCPAVFVSIFSNFYIFVTQSAKKGHEQSQGECSHESTTKWFGSQWKISEIIILQIDKITRLSLQGINCVFC